MLACKIFLISVFLSFNGILCSNETCFRKIVELRTNHEIQLSSLRKVFHNEMSSLKQKLKTLGSRAELVLTSRHKRQVDLEYPMVAFTARLSNHVFHLQPQQHLIYDNILTNLGNGYDNTTGNFTAPVSGIYFLGGSVLSHPADWIQTEIIVNGQNVVAEMYAKSTTNHDQGANFAMVQLQKGDVVWMRVQNNFGDKIYGGNWATFSGFLLSKTSSVSGNQIIG